MSSVGEGKIDAAHTVGFGLKPKHNIAHDGWYKALEKAVSQVDGIPHNVNSCRGFDMKFDEAQFNFIRQYFDQIIVTPNDARALMDEKKLNDQFHVHFHQLCEESVKHYTNEEKKGNMNAAGNILAATKCEEALGVMNIITLLNTEFTDALAISH